MADSDARRAEIHNRLERQRAGTWPPFTLIDVASGRITGMTRFTHVDTGNRTIEIGGTWYAKTCQHTRFNTDCWRQLLQHAFKALDCIAVGSGGASSTGSVAWPSNGR